MRFPARIGRGLAVAAGALMMLWPAILNRYPLMYPDSISYLGDGRPLARILFLHAPKGYPAMRSEFYSLGIFPFHWNLTPWPIVAWQALLTDRKSTRLNSSHRCISYAVFCLKKKQ